jgi:hypothetical protein
MLQRIMAALMSLAVLFGTGNVLEAIENVAHVTVHGHGAHDDGGHRDAASNSDTHRDMEHGCAGGVHVCPCCSHPVMNFAENDTAVPPSSWQQQARPTAPAQQLSLGVKGSVYRPPMTA